MSREEVEIAVNPDTKQRLQKIEAYLNQDAGHVVDLAIEVLWKRVEQNVAPAFEQAIRDALLEDKPVEVTTEAGSEEAKASEPAEPQTTPPAEPEPRRAKAQKDETSATTEQSEAESASTARRRRGRGRSERQLQIRIRDTLLELAGGQTGQAVRLSELRSKLTNTQRSRVDSALRSMWREKMITLDSVRDPAELSRSDTRAQISLKKGLRPRHIITLRQDALQLGDDTGQASARAAKGTKTTPAAEKTRRSRGTTPKSNGDNPEWAHRAVQLMEERERSGAEVIWNEIARVLNSEGRHTSKGHPWSNGSHVKRNLKGLGLVD